MKKALRDFWPIAVIAVLFVTFLCMAVSCSSLQQQVEEMKRLPKTVLVYDRSRKEIVEYYGTPQKIGDSLILHDANILNVEDVSHLVE